MQQMQVYKKDMGGLPLPRMPVLETIRLWVVEGYADIFHNKKGELINNLYISERKWRYKWQVVKVYQVEERVKVHLSKRI